MKASILFKSLPLALLFWPTESPPAPENVAGPCSLAGSGHASCGVHDLLQKSSSVGCSHCQDPRNGPSARHVHSDREDGDTVGYECCGSSIFSRSGGTFPRGKRLSQMAFARFVDVYFLTIYWLKFVSILLITLFLTLLMVCFFDSFEKYIPLVSQINSSIHERSLYLAPIHTVIQQPRSILNRENS